MRTDKRDIIALWDFATQATYSKDKRLADEAWKAKQIIARLARDAGIDIFEAVT